MSSKSFSALFADDGETAPKAAPKKKQVQEQTKVPKAQPAPGQDSAKPKGQQGGAKASRTIRGPRGSEQNTGHRPPKREFERHSGTGRDRSVRKGGAGAFAWGSAKDTTPLDSVTPAPEVETPAAEGAATEEVKAPAAPEPEPEPIFTFEDAMKLRQANAVQGDVKAPRAAIVSDAVKPGAVIHAGKNIGGTKSGKQEESNGAARLIATKKSGKKVVDLAAFSAVIGSAPAPAAAPAESSAPYRKRTQFPSL